MGYLDNKGLTYLKNYIDDISSSYIVDLYVTGWKNQNQVIVNSGFLSDDKYCYIVSPPPDLEEIYNSCMIKAKDVTVDGEMEFTCEELPNKTLQVNIIRLKSKK